MRIPGFYKVIMKYVAPVYLILVFVMFCKNNLGGWIDGVAAEPLRQGALALVAAVTVFLLACVRVGEKRWRRAGMDLDGAKALEEVA
jgi:hypothetical protein